MEVKFLRKLGKSYSVEYKGNFMNSRGPHVETAEPESKLIGKTFKLSGRHTKQIGGDLAVMYYVNGVTNGSHQAHFTAYFGPPANAGKY